MAERLVLEIEIPGFNVEGIVRFTIELTDATGEVEIREQIAEQIALSMNLDSDNVAIVFLVADDAQRFMQPMNGRIVGSKIVQDGD